jgi:arylformamidase
MARIIDCSMILSNSIWRSGWKVNISTRERNTIEVEGIKEKLRGSHISMSAHCGTHLDSPAHHIESGINLLELPLDRCFGEAAVIELTDKGELDPITAEDLENRGKHVKEGDIVLLKTGWMEKNAGGNAEKMEGLPANWDYWLGPYPTRSMAEWMVKKRVKAVGYDCPNESTHHITRDYDFTRKGPSTKEEEGGGVVHRIHLNNGILHIEYLCNLMAIKKDRVKFFAIPLKLKTEGSPVRAFAIEE